jgi:hypothetical protein
MKNTLMILSFCFITFITDAQKKNDAIPAAVKESFAKSFPNVKGVKWSKESETEFEAEFKNKGKEQSANLIRLVNGWKRNPKLKSRNFRQQFRQPSQKNLLGTKLKKQN